MWSLAKLAAMARAAHPILVFSARHSKTASRRHLKCEHAPNRQKAIDPQTPAMQDPSLTRSTVGPQINLRIEENYEKREGSRRPINYRPSVQQRKSPAQRLCVARPKWRIHPVSCHNPACFEERHQIPDAPADEHVVLATPKPNAIHLRFALRRTKLASWSKRSRKLVLKEQHASH
jgi:hypothetical protein